MDIAFKLEESGYPKTGSIGADRSAASLDRPRKHRMRDINDPLTLRFGKPGTRDTRAQSRPETDLIRVDIPDSGDHALIQQ